MIEHWFRKDFHCWVAACDICDWSVMVETMDEAVRLASEHTCDPDRPHA